MASKPPRLGRGPRPVLTNEQVAVVAAPPATGIIEMDTTNTAADQNTASQAQDAAQNAAKTMFTEASERAKGALGKSQAMFGEAAEFGKGNVEALVESSRVAAKGLEAMGQNAAAYMRASVEDMQAQARTLASVSSPTDFVKLQGDFLRQSFEKMVAETSRNAESMLKLVGEVGQPLSNRVAMAMDKAKTAA